MIPLSYRSTHKPSRSELADTRWKEEQLWRGLVGAWFMPEGGGLTAYDYSGYGNHGTLINNPIWTLGKFGRALDFNGISHYINVGSPPAHNFPNHVSVVVFAKLDNVSSVQCFIGQVVAGSGVSGQYVVEVGRTASRITIIWNSTVIHTSSINLVTNQWYQIAWSRSGGAGAWISTIHINGVFDSEVTSSVATGSQQPTAIARAGDFNGEYFDGIIDHVCLWNRMLIASEVKQLYRNHFPDVRRRTWFVPSGAPTTVLKDIIGMGVIPFAR